MKKKYSICIANYNMAETLNSSLESVLNQVDDNYEVIVIDDGSADNSVDILLSLKEKYSNLRVIPLLRDSRRKLGETRNISIRAARGKYVILHIDADDIWEPYINSFAKIYHELEKRLEINDFMLSGRQIQMATKELLLQTPYRNIYYVEDRILWNELAVLGKLVSIDHKTFFKRIPIKKNLNKFQKNLKTQISSIKVSFLYSPSPFKNLKLHLKVIFKLELGLQLSLLRFFIVFPCFLIAILPYNRKFINHANGNTRDLTMFNLKTLEQETLSTHGEYELSNDERKLFNI